MSMRAAVKAWMPVIVAGGVLAVGGVVAIPLGGWDTVQLQSAIIPKQPIGQPYVGQRVATAIDDIYLTDVHPDGYSELEPGEVWLIVFATMENVTTEPQYPFGNKGFYAFTIPGLYELDDSVSIADTWTYLVRDDTHGPLLSPGIPETVMFVFRAPDSAFADGDEIAIGLSDARPEEADLYEGTRWAAAHIAAEVDVVIRDER